MYHNRRQTPSDDISLGRLAVSPPFCVQNPVSSPYSNAPSSVSLPNSVYSYSDFQPTSPKVLGYLPIPVHEESILTPTDKTIIIHRFNGKISRQNWYFSFLRRISSKSIPNISSTTIQILSGK